MEVMGVNFCAGDVEGCDVLGFYVDYAVLVLEWPFNAQKPAASNNNAVTLENVRRNNHISNTRFVFEREEYETLRRARALTRDDATGNAHKSIVAAVREVAGRLNPLSAQGSSMVGHRVWTGSESHAGVVRRDALVGIHLPKRVMCAFFFVAIFYTAQ